MTEPDYGEDVLGLDPREETREPQEWTPERIMSYMRFEYGAKRLAKDFDAAIAAEREKARLLVDALAESRCKLDWSVTDGEFLQRIDDALAKVKE